MEERSSKDGAGNSNGANGKKRKRRALVVGSGGFFGAYDAGVLSAIRDYIHIDAVYTSSVGAFTGSFFAAKQFAVMERVWKNAVGGRAVFSPARMAIKKPALNLDMLLRWCEEGETRLRFEEIESSGIKLIFVLTEYPSGRARYLSATRKTIFTLMKASAAIPYLTNPVALDGIRYVDSAFVDPLPFEHAMQDGYDEVIVISNKPVGFMPTRMENTAIVIAKILRSPLAKLLENYKGKFKDTAKKLREQPGLFIIRPAARLPLRSFLDTNKKRLQETFEQGRTDGKMFLAKYAFVFGLSPAAYERNTALRQMEEDYRNQKTPFGAGEKFTSYACMLGFYLTAALSPLPALNFGVTVSGIWIF